jgi:hypothetical protein
MTVMQGVPTVDVISGDTARWVVTVAGEVVASCRNAALARRTAEQIQSTLEREARVAAIRALADYLEQHPDAPCCHVAARSWADTADALAASAARMPGSALDNTRDSSVSVAVDFGAGVALEVLLSRHHILKPAPARTLPPQLASLPTKETA